MKREKIDIEKLSKKPIHEVPDGYFEGLTLKIQTRINREKEISKSWYQLPKFYWSVSTSAIMALAIVWFLWPDQELRSNHDQTIASLEAEEIVDYLIYDNIDLYDITAHVNVNDILTEMSNEAIYSDIPVSNEDLESLYDEIDLGTDLL